MKALKIPSALLITSVLALVARADDPLRNGHSVKATDPDRQVVISVVMVSVPAKDFVRPTSSADRRQTTKPKALQPPEVSARDLAEAGGIQLVSATSRIETHQPVFAETISEAEKRRMLQEFQSAISANVMFAPKVTVFDEQVATIADTTSRPFVVGVENDGGANHDGDVNETPRARIAEFEEGTKFAMRTTIRRNDAVQLDLNVRLSDLRDVNVLAINEDTSVQVPTVHESSISLSANIERGETLAVWGFQTERRVEVETGVLKNVPYLSRAFSSKTSIEDPIQLMLLVTPTILDTNNAAD